MSEPTWDDLRVMVNQAVSKYPKRKWFIVAFWGESVRFRLYRDHSAFRPSQMKVGESCQVAVRGLPSLAWSSEPFIYSQEFLERFKTPQGDF